MSIAFYWWSGCGQFQDPPCISGVHKQSSKSKTISEGNALLGIDALSLEDFVIVVALWIALDWNIVFLYVGKIFSVASSITQSLLEALWTAAFAHRRQSAVGVVSLFSIIVDDFCRACDLNFWKRRTDINLTQSTAILQSSKSMNGYYTYCFQGTMSIRVRI